jgi:hypothetical protein
MWAMSETIHDGIVGSGFQSASGGAVGRADNPYPAPTLLLQQPHLRARGIDLDALVPGWFVGTINVVLPYGLFLAKADMTADLLDWTSDLGDPKARIPPESFSFVHGTLHHGGARYLGLIYYPHPETKPSVNAHHYDVLEVIAPPVAGLRRGDPVAIACRAGAFVPRGG